MPLETVCIDFNNPSHCQHLVELLDAYATDPMGGGEPLSDYVRAHLIEKLAEQSSYRGFITYIDGQQAALANCFMGFSTFACRPLMNIHDFVVLPDYRGKGVSQALMESVANFAKSSDCCKLTLEVLSGNTTAINAYKKFGFAFYQLDEKAGSALFMECKLK